ncbi:MAG: RNA-binding protein [Theionarchaea archaeon]|nr:RNA-binding protein [Theionarchaea archaeon]MBU7000621.1 RNA-binding protein [Theionarchaea archaeon]MBU7021996.1 RNA-binding protein [Theionarchaea archaeon]MBU7036085.1 RNA-binding protein [Theionarchaea archaeon]MBU7041675.1 RNA-binding protein [Theionarchaea archaeon]
MEIKKRHDLKSSKVKDLKNQVREELGEEFLPLLDGNRFEICTTDTDINLIVVDGTPVLMKKKVLFPTLRAFVDTDCRTIKHHVTVDMGAVPYVTNGADVMRPGITEIDASLEAGDFVIITEERHGKPLAVGETLYSSREIIDMDQGKVIKTIHYVGDRMWKLTL